MKKLTKGHIKAFIPGAVFGTSLIWFIAEMVRDTAYYIFKCNNIQDHAGDFSCNMTVADPKSFHCAANQPYNITCPDPQDALTLSTQGQAVAFQKYMKLELIFFPMVILGAGFAASAAYEGIWAHTPDDALCCEKSFFLELERAAAAAADGLERGQIPPELGNAAIYPFRRGS